MNMCATADYLFKSASLGVLVTFRATALVVGICLMLALLRFHDTRLALHKNARYLLTGHHIATIAMCAGFLMVHITDIHRFLKSYRNPCDNLLTMAVSVSLRAPSTLAVYVSVLAFFSLAVERCYATVYFKTYEYSAPFFSIWLIAVQVRLKFA